MTYNIFYRITNLVNGRFYYGVHKTKNLNDHYLGRGIAIQLAIKKYGRENFKKEILCLFDSYSEALEYESRVVDEAMLNNPLCYNLKKGGMGGSFKGINKGRKHTPEHIEKIRAHFIGWSNIKLKKPIKQYDLEMNYIQDWDSTADAANALRISRDSIKECLRGRNKRAGSFIFRFKNQLCA